MAMVHSGEEILPKVSTPEYDVQTLQTTDRRQTDGFAIAMTRTQRRHVRVIKLGFKVGTINKRLVGHSQKKFKKKS